MNLATRAYLKALSWRAGLLSVVVAGAGAGIELGDLRVGYRGGQAEQRAAKMPIHMAGAVEGWPATPVFA
jgi:hypothetical protein